MKRRLVRDSPIEALILRHQKPLLEHAGSEPGLNKVYTPLILCDGIIRCLIL